MVDHSPRPSGAIDRVLQARGALGAKQQAAPATAPSPACSPALKSRPQAGVKGRANCHWVCQFRSPRQARCSLTARKSLNHCGALHTSAITAGPKNDFSAVRS